MTTKDVLALAALEIAVRQNSHDMLMTGEELRKCEAAITAIKQAQQAQEPVDKCVTWTTGPNEWKDWCAQWFGPDADDDYLAKAVFALPLMAQNFKLAAPKQAEPAIKESLTVPEGYKLVPVEPTPEMCDAGAYYMNSPTVLIAKNAHAFYKAMLAAAPEPKP